MQNPKHSRLETLDLDHVLGGWAINIRLPFGFVITNRSQRIIESNRSWEGGWNAASEFYNPSRLGKR